MAGTGRDSYSPVADTVPFDNGTNGFIADTTQAAIEEAYQLGANASRGPTICGFDGTAATGRWLEFFSNNPSDIVPFIVAEDAELVALSVVTGATTATGTVTIYRNGSSIQTIALAAQKKNAISGLAHTLTSLSEVSVRVTAGSISRCTVYLFIRTLP